jgi:hypothetical protein
MKVEPSLDCTGQRPVPHGKISSGPIARRSGGDAIRSLTTWLNVPVVRCGAHIRVRVTWKVRA